MRNRPSGNPRPAASRRQAGFGLLESLTGLIVFVILVAVGTKAFRNVVSNHKAAAEIKALTDAVATTAEKLSALSVSALTLPSAGYLDWSAPQPVGLGPFLYRFRIVPGPSIAGVTDTSVVGLEVEAGVLDQNQFVAGRSFATLIGPHVTSKNHAGEVSNAQERQAEADFYASLMQSIKSTRQAELGENQTRLNSFSCYDKGQCCGFMKRYFQDQTLSPKDGLDQMCDYRCAQAGNVPVKDWNAACGTDFCALAPWRTKQQCCDAIAAGACKPGTVCASVCIDCLGEDGSTCAPPPCDDGWWNDFFDCANGTYCNGQPLPDGPVAGPWGNVKQECKVPKCAAIPASCESMKFSCCSGYWQRLAMGATPWAGSEVCPMLTQASDCCESQITAGYYDLNCGTDGRIVSSYYFNKNQTYCGAPPGSDWDKYCAVTKGCPSTFVTAGTGSCGGWPNNPTDPWTDPDPSSPGVHSFGSSFNGNPGGTGTSQTSTGGAARDPSNRGGSVGSSQGGQE